MVLEIKKGYDPKPAASVNSYLEVLFQNKFFSEILLKKQIPYFLK